MNEEKTIRSMFRMIDARQFDDLASLTDPDIVYERPGYDPIRGGGGFLHFYRHVRAVQEGVHQVDYVLGGEAADTVMGCGRFQGVLKDGTGVDVRFAELYQFKAGKIVFRRTYFFQPSI